MSGTKENAVKPRTGEEPVKPSEKKPEGGRFSAAQVDRYLRFIVFLVLIGMVYIWNAHTAEKQIRKMEQLTDEIEELRCEYTMLDADMSFGTKQSEIAARVDSLGLKKLTKPPFKLVKKVD